MGGVYVNNKQKSTTNLKHGDIIKIQGRKITFLEKDKSKAFSSTAFYSKNQDWNNKLKQITKVVNSKFPILILGETGTGKDVLARQIHQQSTRREKPFISINCSALSENLIESELFGHLKGSYTGATTDRQGAFEAARGGTLFLDEIGELPKILQPKLLRALDNKEVKPVGSDISISTDVVIIAATQANLVEKIQNKEFRDDLYHRLNIIKISPPPLRKRMQDFEDLLLKFCKDYKTSFSHAAVKDLKDYEWPGNIRELKNVVARASALIPDRNVESEDIHDILDPIKATPKYNTGSENNVFSIIDFIKEGKDNKDTTPLIQRIEKKLIMETLENHKGNQRRTAEDLNMAKSTLHDKLKKYEINYRTYKE